MGFKHSPRAPSHSLDGTWEVEKPGVVGQGRLQPSLTRRPGPGAHRVNGSQIIERQVDPSQVPWVLQQL